MGASHCAAVGSSLTTDSRSGLIENRKGQSDITVSLLLVCLELLKT